MKLSSARAAVAVATASLIAACGGIGDSPTPTSVVMVDLSGSTRGLVGEFKPAIEDAVCRTAKAEGKVWAAGGDAAVLANSTWNIDGKKFTAPDVGEALQELDLEKMCQQALKEEGRSLLSAPNRRGSDLVGLLKMAAGVLSANPDGPRSLLFLTDGGINALGVDLFRNPPKTDAERTRLIGQFADKGLVARNSLTGGKGQPVRVWLCGVGRGGTGNDGLTAVYVQDFWKQLIAYVGGEVVTAAPSCSNLEGFASK